MNPIENMWTVLKKQVCARNQTNLVELHRVVKDSVREPPEACGWLSKAPGPEDLVTFSENL